MSFTMVHFKAALSGLLLAGCCTLPTASALSSDGVTPDSLDRHCGALSPRLVSMGDNYFDLDAGFHQGRDTPVSRQLSEQDLRAALRAERFVAGQGQRTECLGSGDELHARSSTVRLHDIESRMRTGSHSETDHGPANTTVIKAYEYDERQRRSRAASVTVPASAVAIDTFSGILISSHQRQRQRTPSGSYLRETALTALRTRDELIIEQSLYVNGTLAEWHTWQLIPQGS